MIKISELQEGNVLSTNGFTNVIVLQNLGKAIVVESEAGFATIYSEKELNNRGFKLVPPTPEKKYFMGFEVREYPERPIVEVSDDEIEKCLLRLFEVKEKGVICTNSNHNLTIWKFIYRIPETKINE